MKNRVTGLRLASVTAIALSSLIAHAADQSWPAFVVCAHDLNGSLGVDGTGIKNTSGSTRNIVCSVGQDNGVDSNDDVLVYYNETSTTAAMVCGVGVYASDHSTQTLGDYKWACSSAGGCAGAPANSFTGAGYIRLGDIWHGTGWISTVSCSTPNNSTVRSLTLDEQ